METKKFSFLMMGIRCGIPFNNILHQSLDNKPNTDLEAMDSSVAPIYQSTTRTPTRI
jgi:hypothetical protein